MSHATADVSSGWIARFGLLYLGQNIAWSAPAQLLIANQILAWYPNEKEVRLGYLMAAGGLAAMLSGPLAGALSDRSRSRWGQRAPFIAGGALGAAACLLWMGWASGYVTVFVAWLVFQFSLAISITTAQAVPPDRVPRHQFGVVSGVMGLTYTFAVVLGTVIGDLFTIPMAYSVCALAILACAAPFLLRYRQSLPLTAAAPAPSASGPSPSAASGPSASGPSAPDHSASGPSARLLPSWREHSDYWWVFIARLLVTMAQALALFYLLYFLRDRIKYANPDGGVVILSLVYAVCVVMTAVWSGRVSDRLGKRKIFVAGSSYGVAVACLIMASVTSFALVVVAAMVLGISWGVYQAIDQALINEVLPSGTDRAKDMGLINLAVHVPNALAPLVAAFAVTTLGGYPGLYVLAAVLTILGGVLIRKVRGVA